MSRLKRPKLSPLLFHAHPHMLIPSGISSTCINQQKLKVAVKMKFADNGVTFSVDPNGEIKGAESI